MASPKLKNDYQVGIITALPMERAAVRAMLDQEHPPPADYKQHQGDPNSYSWGSIGNYDIVMASLAVGVYGTTSATTTVIPMKYAFPSIKWGLMVGIGAGVPSHVRDIRLGDVAVSQPIGNSGGVFQYDLGKLMHDNKWKRSDWLARPPDVLLKALGSLQAEHEFTGISRAQQFLGEAFDRHRHWGKSFARPQTETDRLFETSYSHQSLGKGCATCDPVKIVQRPPREEPDFLIHYGVIASGNSLVKNPKFREKILEMEEDCICIEMEAAGLMNDLPCLVIRGICDYADSHKHDAWQRYASATAAAFAKELLTFSSEIELTLVGQISHQDPSSRSTSVVAQGTSDAMKNVAIRADIIPTRSFSPPRSQQANKPSRAASTWNIRELTPSERQAAYTYIRRVFGITEDWELPQYVNLKEFSSGDSLLLVASRQGNYAVARVLIDNQANVLNGNNRGDTPLHFAVEAGNQDLVKLLIDRGANVNTENNFGTTPLASAVRNDHRNVTQLLIDRGADINAGDEVGWPILSFCKSVDMAKLLLANGAKLVSLNGPKAVKEFLAQYSREIQ